jgi:hypothetical protein
MKNAELSTAQTHAAALRIQREHHWLNYDEARRREILARVRHLVEQNPNGYLARVWKEVYR